MHSQYTEISVGHWGEKLREHGVLLTVNQRLSRHYHALYEAWRISLGDTCWETPQILPLSAWFRSVHDTAVLKRVSTNVVLHDLAHVQLWQQCVEHDLKHYKGADALAPLLNIEAAAREAGKAWSIEKQWGIALDASQPLSIDQRAYHRWRTKFNSLCAENSWVDSASLGDHVLELIHQHSDSLELPSSVQLAGFLHLTSQQRSLLDGLRSASISVFELPMVNPDRPNAAQQLLFDNETAEISYVAARARALLELNASARIGIVVPDLLSRRLSVLRALDGEFFPGLNPLQITRMGRPYDVSLGVPLIELPAVRVALLSLAFYESAIDTKELSQWLLSPYLVDAEKYSPNRIVLDRDLRRQSLKRMRLQEFAQTAELDGALKKAVKKIQKLRIGSPRTLSAYGKLFSAVLDELGWPGRSLDSEEFQSIEAWRSVLDDVQHLDNDTAMSGATALRLIRQLCSERVFQPEAATVPIQIMGRLESHGLEFDHLMVVGLDSNNWPPVTSSTAFLPFALQKEVGVPEASKDMQLDIARAELSAWCTAAADVRLSSVHSRDGQDLTRTELLSGIALLEPDINVLDQQSAAQQIAELSSAPVHAVVDTHGPALQDDEKAKGGARLFEDQAQCPFRAFALHRLRIRPMEEATMGLDPRAHGNLLHYALEFFWTDVKSQSTLASFDDEKIKTVLLDCINRSLEFNEIPEVLRDLERTRLLVLLFDWMKERELRRGDFEIDELEVERTVSYQGFQLTLKVDRIDRLPSGQKLILDYKTGINNNPKGWAQERIENPQLPLYALVTENVDGVAYAQIARNESKFLGIASDRELLNGVVSAMKVGDGEIADWQSWLDHWRASLDVLADELKQGLATVTPTKKACQFCDLPSLCRIADAADADLSVDVAGPPEQSGVDQ